MIQQVLHSSTVRLLIQVNWHGIVKRNQLRRSLFSPLRITIILNRPLNLLGRDLMHKMGIEMFSLRVVVENLKTEY